MAVSSNEPIRVFLRDGAWMVDYGTYANDYYDTRVEAVERATRAAHIQQRDLVVEAWPRTKRRGQWWSSTVEPQPIPPVTPGLPKPAS